MSFEHEEASTTARDDFERFRRSERTRRDTERKRKDMAVKKFIVVRAGLAAMAVTALAACGSGSSDSPASSAASGASSVASSAAPSTSASTSVTGSATASATQTQSTAPSAQGSPSTTAGAAAPSASTSHPSMTSVPGSARPSAASPSTNAAAGHDAPRRYTAAVWGLFTTPSGVQHCQVSADTASCYLSSAVMAKHQGSNVVLLAKDGWLFNTSNLGSNEGGSGSAWARTGGATPKVLNGLPVLSYGSSLSVGSNTCKSSPVGVTCSNGVAGFTLNSRGVTTTGVKASR